MNLDSKQNLLFWSALLKQARTQIELGSRPCFTLTNSPRVLRHIGLWLLSGAVPWQIVHVFHPSASTLKVWFFPQFMQYWRNPVGCLGCAWTSAVVASFVPGSFLGMCFVRL